MSFEDKDQNSSSIRGQKMSTRYARECEIRPLSMNNPAKKFETIKLRYLFNDV